MSARVLIFDDEIDILELCIYILESNGYEVITRQTCINVIDVIAEVSPDLIIMDNLIPETGGIKATLAIKDHPDFKNIPVIFFTASNEAERLAALAQADAFLGKPFDLKILEKTVKEMLKQNKLDQ